MGARTRTFARGRLGAPHAGWKRRFPRGPGRGWSGPADAGHRLRAALRQVLQKPVGAGRPVAHEGPEREAAGKLRHPLEVVRLTGKDREADQVAERVHHGHGPARQATSRTPDALA